MVLRMATQPGRTLSLWLSQHAYNYALLSLPLSLTDPRVYTYTLAELSRAARSRARGTNTNGVARSTGGPNRRPLISSRAATRNPSLCLPTCEPLCPPPRYRTRRRAVRRIAVRIPNSPFPAAGARRNRRRAEPQNISECPEFPSVLNERARFAHRRNRERRSVGFPVLWDLVFGRKTRGRLGRSRGSSRDCAGNMDEAGPKAPQSIER